MPPTKRKTQSNQRRKPKQARALEKYNAVLDACTQLLLAQGYSKITILELSLEADVAVPTIYQYFENKESIFVAWIDRVMDQVLGSVAFSESQIHESQISGHIDNLVTTALVAVNFYRPGLQQLLSEVPNSLSSRVIEKMESKTLISLRQMFPERFANTDDEQLLEFTLLTLIRLITGYFIQAILNNTRDLDSKKEGKEIATMAKLYLQNNDIEI